MLTRLQDKVEDNGDGTKKYTQRYGLWGITAETVKLSKGKYAIFNKGKKLAEFPTLAEAEAYMLELFDKR